MGKKRPLSPNAPKPVNKKYKNKFNFTWKNDFKFIDSSVKGVEFAFCKICRVDLKISSGGKNDIQRHSETKLHKESSSAVSGTVTIANFTKSDAMCNVTKAELLFTNFIVEHNLPFLVADHFTELQRQMFPDSEIARKFSCKRTKATHIVTQALGPSFDQNVQTICQKNKFTLMIDESNDQGGDKFLAVLVRVYDQTVRRVSTLFLGMPICNIGTSEAIFNTVNELFREKQIPWSQCVGFSSDNCNVMVGKNNSVLTRVRNENPKVYDVGCVCHIANICASKAVKGLPVPVEDLLTDVYFHFYHSSKRKETLKQFQDFTDTEPMKLLKHCGTRWLSLERCVERLLQQWPALKSYFCSHEESENGGRVQRCATWLSSDIMWLTFAFLSFVLPILNEFNTTFQAGASMIGHLDTEMTRLLRKLLGRFVQTKVILIKTDITAVPYFDRSNQLDDEILAVGWRAREFIQSDEVNPQDSAKFFCSAREFYETVVGVMVKKFPFKDKTLKAMGYLNPETKMNVSPIEVEELGRRFLDLNRDELNQLEEEAQEYITTPIAELPPASDSLEEFWASMADLKKPCGKKRFPALCELSHVTLALPHSNADVERVFSILRKLQTDSRGNLDHKTINSILSSKINNKNDCHDFHPTKELLVSTKKVCTQYLANKREGKE